MTRRTVDPHIQDRSGWLYVRYKTAAGAWLWKSTGLPADQLEDARRIRDVLHNKAAPSSAPGAPLTVEGYAKDWIAARRKADLASVGDDESRLRKHLFPRFGSRLLRDVKGHEVKAWAAELVAKGLAPSTVINIYTVASTMFADAEGDAIIERTPFNRRRDRIPRKKDKVRGWRRTAKFDLAEVELLLDPANGIAEDRRVFYALALLGGGRRFGEAAACRVRDLDRTKRPLWRLHVDKSYSTKLRREKSTKTERDVEAPVHPVLQRILSDWLTGGWVRFFGRFPTPDDLIVPSRRGQNRNVNHMLRRFHQDLKRLGLRPRRQHDLRRSFWSLCLDAGANKERLRWVVWGRPDGIDGDYDQAGWEAVCADVLKLQLHPGRGEVVALAAGGEDSGDGFKVAARAVEQSMEQTQRVGSTQAILDGKIGGADGTRSGAQAGPAAPRRAAPRLESRSYEPSGGAAGARVGLRGPGRAPNAPIRRRPYQAPAVLLDIDFGEPSRRPRGGQPSRRARARGPRG